MPDLSLKSVLIRNWMSCRDVTLEFPSCGLIWVSGTVGSGKTALGEAICRTLIGSGSRFSRLGEASTDEKGNLYVKLDCTLGDKKLSVELGHRCAELSKSGEGLRFTYNDRKVEHGHIDKTREELTRVIRVSPKLAKWAVFVDGAKIDFDDLPEKEAVELLMESLSQPPWTQWHENAKKTSASFDVALAQAESEHANATSRRAQAEKLLNQAKTDLEAANSSYAKAVADQQPELERKKVRKSTLLETLAQCKASIADSKEAIRKIETDHADDFHRLEIERQGLVDQMAQGKPERKKLNDAVNAADSEWRRLNKEHSTLAAKPTKCPTCSRAWDRGPSEQEISVAKQKLTDAAQQLQNAEVLLTQANAVADGLNKQIEDVDERHGGLRKAVRREVESISRSIEEWEDKAEQSGNALETVNSQLATLEQGPSTAAIDRAEAVLDERTRALEKAESDVKTAASAIVEAKEAVKVVRYWVKAFGASGIPNMVLKESIAPLNDTSRRISSMLTAGNLNVAYATSKEMATGQERAKLVMTVEHKRGSAMRTGNVRGSSKGQAGITNLIVAETLSSVGNVSSRVGFRWYDEVLNSQDPLVRRATLAYLKDLAHRMGILIFIVDHHPEPANYADKILLVEQDANEITTVRWAA